MHATLEEQFLSGGWDSFPKAVLSIVSRLNKSDLAYSLNFSSILKLYTYCHPAYW